MKRYLFLLFMFFATVAFSQPEKGKVRSGNRAFSEGDIEKAELEYRRALENNPTSIFGRYNLGNALYKRGNSEEAQKIVSDLVDSLDNTPLSSMVNHNLGNYALDQKKYSEAIEYYKNSLRVNPSDLETKSNLAYAQAMLKNDENKDDKNNQDNKDNQDKKDDKKDQDNQDKKDQDNQDKKENQDNKDDKQDNNQSPPKITPQTAQQMLQAIQNKEKETQEKVNKEKAKVLKGKQKEKNW